MTEAEKNIIQLFSYPKAPVQESKQLLPQLHKPLHLSVNVSDFVTLIVPYFALGRKKKKKKKKVICLENKQEYTFVTLFYSSAFCSTVCVLFSDHSPAVTSPTPHTLFPPETP